MRRVLVPVFRMVEPSQTLTVGSCFIGLSLRRHLSEGSEEMAVKAGAKLHTAPLQHLQPGGPGVFLEGTLV
jgi:hypothetical protein